MVCDVCGKKGARVRRITRSYGRGRLAFLIEGIPLVACPSCGESYFTPATIEQIEHIRKQWRRLAVNKRIPVAPFGGAA